MRVSCELLEFRIIVRRDLFAVNPLHKQRLYLAFEIERAPAPARRKRYVITEETEDRLGEIYTDPAYAKRKSKKIPVLNDYAAEVGIP